MTTTQIIASAQLQGVTLSIDGDDLCLEAAPGVITLELKREIKAHKADIIRQLSLHTTKNLVYDTPPLTCRKCHTTKAEDFRVNVMRNRWVCCNCGTLSRLVYPPTLIDLPEPAQPGEELEQLRQAAGEMVREQEETESKAI